MRFWSARDSALFFRSLRFCFGDFASSLCCFQLPPLTSLPEAVSRTRLAAPRFVFSLGILSPLQCFVQLRARRVRRDGGHELRSSGGFAAAIPAWGRSRRGSSETPSDP